MRCPACLAEVIGSGKYCASCGTRISQAGEAAAAPAPPAAPAPIVAGSAADNHDDMALSPTDLPPASQAASDVDPFASTADPSASHMVAAEVAAAHAADAGRVSPLASSSFDLGSDPSPVSRGPLPAAGNPPPSMASPNSVAPRSKHGSTVLLSAMPARPLAPKPAPGPAPVAAHAPVTPAARPQVAIPAAPVAAPAHAPAPPSGYAQSPASKHMAPPSSALAPSGPGVPASSAVKPGARVIVTFPSGQRVFGTVWQCAQAHYLIQFPDGKSQWVELGFVRPV